MRNTLLIARREYLEQVRSKAFKFSTIGLPAALAIIFGISYLSSLGLGGSKHMAVASSDVALANDLRNRLTSEKNSKAEVDVVAPAKLEDRERLTEQVRIKAIDGLLWIETPAGGIPTATYYSQSAGDFMSTARLKDALDNSLVSEHLTGAGMKQADADALLKGTSIQSFQVKKDGQLVKSNAFASFWKGYAMALLLTMTTMIYGMNVARSVIQEKTSRVFEVTCWLESWWVRELWGLRRLGFGWLRARPFLSRLLQRPHSRETWLSTSPGWSACFSRFTSCLAFCSSAHCSRGLPLLARQSRNCRCTCLWPQRPHG